MDPTFQFPASPGRPSPLFPVSLDRANRQSENLSPTHSRDSSVHEKISKFDSLAYQGKALERKTADAALKRAMLGREEAENDMRRYRDEARTLRKAVEEGKERERKVCERLENEMERSGRGKETYAHSKENWEKEIRRLRKESFKLQSLNVKLREELQSARASSRIVQGDLSNEKERSSKREQEAFEARYQIVGVQEELANMIEKIKLVEQERDALKSIAKNEEIVRIAAEGHIPLPRSTNDEFASPRKVTPLMKMEVLSSLASVEEIEQLRQELSWEKKRSESALDQVEFMKIECQFNGCSCRISERRGNEFVYLSAPEALKSATKRSAGPAHPLSAPVTNFDLKPKSLGENLIPSEGAFRTIDQAPEESPWISPAKHASLPQSKTQSVTRRSIFTGPEQEDGPRVYARTPSCEPPSTAIIPDSRVSLASLLAYDSTQERSTLEDSTQETPIPSDYPQRHGQEEHVEETPQQVFHTISTTTRIPLACPNDETPDNNTVSQNLVMAGGLPVSLDPALSPTMTREEALAMIRERRGRARSLAQGTLTPKKQMVEGASARRDISAPAVRSGAIRGRPTGKS